MKLVVVSTALPRRCGLASFTDDLRTALNDATPWDVSVCAIDRTGLDYGPEVMTVVRQYDAEDYRRAARTIAEAGTDLVVIEHEFGIFGGPDGLFVLEMADELRMLGVRYAVTLHTVLSQPSRRQRDVLQTLCAGAALVTVFAEEGRRLAVATGVATESQTVVVPHGAPAVLRQSVGRDQLRPEVDTLIRSVDRSFLITTFGLVGPGKGLEHGIEALAEVVRRFPDTYYLIAGATHPDVLQQSGESHREQIAGMAEELGVADRVLFLNTYLSEAELAAVLARTDLFLTPYRSPEQICSGALTFALAAGRPVVATAYRYATEMLAARPGDVAPGVIVSCDDVPAMARAIAGLLGNPHALVAAREAAIRLGNTLIWPAVVQKYANAFTAATGVAALTVPRPRVTHELQLAHLDRMTNQIGIAQFAAGAEPNWDCGYCVDDIARLGLVAARLHGLYPANPLPMQWLNSCLRFLRSALRPPLRPTGMHNVMDHSGTWLDLPHSGDHVGRTIWAAAHITAATEIPLSVRVQALDLMRQSVGLLDGTSSLRTCGYSLLGLTLWQAPEFEPLALAESARLACASGDDPDWLWFEDTLTYDNARLPQALIAAGAQLGNAKMIQRGLSTLDWYLIRVGLTGPNPVLRLVGNGWRGNGRLTPSAHEGDEQPIDAAAVVEALVVAWRFTGNRRYAVLARQAFDWFHGVNRAHTALYDPISGGCRDGLSSATVSANQGAESTLAYFQALLALSDAGLIQVRPLDYWTPSALPELVDAR